jgi:hypothetical protein
MHRVLLGLVLGGALAAPAASQSYAVGAFTASAAFRYPSSRLQTASGVRVHRLVGVPQRFDRRARRRSPGGFAYAYPPDYYDSNYDIDRSWDADSFNDWWHDRPDRAYPRWVWHNRNCTDDRLWWSGAGWRCTP